MNYQRMAEGLRKTVIRQGEAIVELKANNARGELQCMESCLSQGFTLEDYIESKRLLLKILDRKLVIYGIN